MDFIEFLKKSIVDAHLATTSTIVGQDNKNIEAFLLSSAGGLNLYLIPTAMGLKTSTESIFSKSQHRDYILNVTVRFQTLFNGNGFDYDEVIKHVAESMVVVNDYSEKALMPKEISDRLPTFDEVFSVLKNNKWLFTFVLLIIFYKDILDKIIE